MVGYLFASLKTTISLQEGLTAVLFIGEKIFGSDLEIMPLNLTISYE